jgi:hypothetical protein
MADIPSVMESQYPAPQVSISTAKEKIAGCVVIEPNLSVAWLHAFRALAAPGVKALAPLVVSVTGFHEGHPEEILAIRSLLDRSLAEQADHKAEADKQKKERRALTCRGVANTIFPGSLWNPGSDRQLLYKRVCSRLLCTQRSKHRA